MKKVDTARELLLNCLVTGNLNLCLSASNLVPSTYMLQIPLDIGLLIYLEIPYFF